MHKVKFAQKYGRSIFGKQFPGQDQFVWGDCKFSFDLADRDYDWLVVVDNTSGEELACPPEQTIFVATEPSSISYYGAAFVQQFAYLITNQDESSLPHPNALRTQPGNRWFYEKTYDQIQRDPPYEKSKVLSAIATHKSEKHTLHSKRLEFIQQVIEEVPETELLYSRKDLEETFSALFDGKAKYVPGKYAMIDEYRYHLAIGNEEGPNILTERVSDSFLGYAVPISFGCTNLADYFPPESFIEIDIRKPRESIEKIIRIIRDAGDYERRLDSVIEARRRVMEDYNLIAMIARIIDHHSPGKTRVAKRRKIYGRRLARAMNPKDLAGFARFRLVNFMKELNIFKGRLP